MNKKFFDKFGKLEKRLAAIVAMGITVSALWVGVTKVVHVVDDYKTLPEENALQDRIIESLHYDVLDLNERMEMIWHQAMANTYQFDDNRYYIVLPEGNQIEVYIRSDYVEPEPEQWVFYEICKGVLCHHYMYKVVWSGVYQRFYFVDLSGDEYHIYKY